MHTNSFDKRFVIQERTLQSQTEKRCCIPLVQGVRRCGSSMILVSSHLSEPSLECADPVTEETRESNETIQTPVVGVGVVWIPFRPPIIDCLIARSSIHIFGRLIVETSQPQSQECPTKRDRKHTSKVATLVHLL